MTQGEGGWRGVRVERRFLTPIGLWNVLCEWSAVVTAHLLLQSSNAFFSLQFLYLHALYFCRASLHLRRATALPQGECAHSALVTASLLLPSRADFVCAYQPSCESFKCANCICAFYLLLLLYQKSHPLHRRLQLLAIAMACCNASL